MQVTIWQKIELSIFFKYNFNMISFFKIYVSIYHLIDLLTLYLNKLIYLYSNECWNIFIGIYLFFHKKPCAISKN